MLCPGGTVDLIWSVTDFDERYALFDKANVGDCTGTDERASAIATRLIPPPSSFFSASLSHGLRLSISSASPVEAITIAALGPTHNWHAMLRDTPF